MDYSKVLLYFYKDKSWSCGISYEDLLWNEEEPQPSKEELEGKWNDVLIFELREKRNKLLQETDFRVLPDYPHRDKWLVYRQELRDFPSTWSTGKPFPQPPI